jgi:hypothetical protein
MSKTNFKSVARSNRRKKSKLSDKHGKSFTEEQALEAIKSITPELNDLEVNVFTHISAVYLKQGNFTLSDYQMAMLTGASIEDIKNAINHLIDLKYFKVIPSAENFGYLRYLEPAIEFHCFIMKLRNFRRINQSTT